MNTYFKNIIVRSPSESVSSGLTTSNLGVPDPVIAKKQHNSYIKALESCGCNVYVEPPCEQYPDSCFVEDPVLCTPYGAILLNPGAKSRKGEVTVIKGIINKLYGDNIASIKDPDTVDGGDILMVDNHYYIGLSKRTNISGAKSVIAILEHWGLTGSIIELKNLFHLKSGVAYLENNTILASEEIIAKPEFEKFEIIEVDSDETYAANSIWVNGSVIMPEGFTKTRSKIKKHGYSVIEVDTSEFRKIDGGVSCLSLRLPSL